MNLCPKVFVLYVLNCTMSKLHYGDSPSFSPLKSFYCKASHCLDRLPETNRQQKKKYRKSKPRTHTTNVIGLFIEEE